MVYTHHSHVTCEDCGTKHIPGNTEACIETLKEQVAELKAGLATVNRIIYAQGAPLGSNEYFDIREVVAPFGR